MPNTLSNRIAPDDHERSRVPKIHRRQPLAGRADPAHAEPCPGLDDATITHQNADKASGGRDGGPTNRSRPRRTPHKRRTRPDLGVKPPSVAGQAFPPEPDS
ncbi:hypothetical protein GCM10023107_50510 [Actinoplanes octamycinicus]|nr:hypothetical protein Aoc01nite_03970 [Actinoplanes octamycinicus]